MIPSEIAKQIVNSWWFHKKHSRFKVNSRTDRVSLSDSGFTMNARFVSWIHYLFREFLMNSLSASRLYYEFTLNSLLFSRFHYAFIILFAKSLWIHYLFRAINMNSLSASRIHYLFREFSMNSQWNHYTINMNLLSISQFLFGFHIFARINYLFREFLESNITFAESL